MPNRGTAKTESAPRLLKSPQVIILGGILFVLIFWSVGVTWLSNDAANSAELNHGGQKIQLEIADSDSERALGLGGRNYLPLGSGMLFVFSDSEPRCFWMKDTHVALDMIWLDEHQNVVHIESEVLPDTFPEKFCADQKPARYVIELSAGQAQKLGISPGVQLRF